MPSKSAEVIHLSEGQLACPPLASSGIHVFKGIRYAAPPVGPLRFRPPQPVAKWKGVRTATKFGNNSLQGVVFSDIDPLRDGTSEDCLYLNVWTGADPAADEKRAVLFWIHGGGFVVGSGSEPRYDGSRLAERGVVVVTVNHRLNALGYLAHPALTAEQGSSGNYAMLDLIAALQWVQRNIAAFGGDPARVTVAGESAGSMACSLLMVSPLAKGLFAGIIGESGGLLATPSEPLVTLAQAEQHGLAFADKLGAKTASDLRALAAEDILKAAPGLGFRPIIDEHVVIEHPRETFAKRQQHDVPMLVGWTKDEGFNFNTANWNDDGSGISHWLEKFFGKRAAEAKAYYPDTQQGSRDLGGDLVINHGTWVWLESQRAQGASPLYRYRFDHAPVTQKGFFPPGAKNPGAFHSCELPYVFDNPASMGWHVSEADRIVANRTANYWANFIKTGNPNAVDLPFWPPYRDEDCPCLRIAEVCSLQNDIDGERHRFLDEALER